MSTSSTRPRVAVLYQAVDPPIVNGVKKPPKPGGYADSGADIAYALREAGHQAVTPLPLPDPRHDLSWCFPDTEAGILSAISEGANTLWANTILFSFHPLQTSTSIPENINVIGQPPNIVEKYDDKALTNDLLRSKGTFTLPKAWAISAADQGFFTSTVDSLPYPVVAKPVRGRGSHGVKLCNDKDTLLKHTSHLLAESPKIMIEEYLAGEEATITVMPPGQKPGSGTDGYWSLPPIVRFNHHSGIAPYNGIVAILSNSRAVPSAEMATDPAYARISRECEAAAALLQTTAPIRVDVRRSSTATGAAFAMFDINMKPNMTGPGRPGREDQASLTALAAKEVGWDYADLLMVMMNSARTIKAMRDMS